LAILFYRHHRLSITSDPLNYLDMEPRKKQRRQGSPPFTPTNQAARVEMQDVDEITAPQRVSLALWRNDVTDTHKRVESSAQDVRVLRDPWYSNSKLMPPECRGSYVASWSAQSSICASHSCHILRRYNPCASQPERTRTLSTNN
jgi:hypothetical protein